MMRNTWRAFRPAGGLIFDTAAQVLSTGADVVLDWNHWSPEKRSESAAWAADHDASYVVHHIATSVQTARHRLSVRNAGGDEHSHAIEEEGVEHAFTYLVPPADDEGHAVCLHGSDAE